MTDHAELSPELEEKAADALERLENAPDNGLAIPRSDHPHTAPEFVTSITRALNHTLHSFPLWDNCVLEMDVSGHPLGRQNVTWYHEGKRLNLSLASKYRFVFRPKDNHPFHYTLILHINDVSDLDGGEYSCNVSNHLGGVVGRFRMRTDGMGAPRCVGAPQMGYVTPREEADEEEDFVEVQEPKVKRQRVEADPVDPNQEEETAYRMVVEARSTALPTTVRWTRDGIPVEQLERYGAYQVECRCDNNEYYRCTLRIPDLTVTLDKGCYECVIRNPFGNLTTRFEVEGEVNPLAPRFWPDAKGRVQEMLAKRDPEDNERFMVFKARFLVPAYHPSTYSYAMRLPTDEMLIEDLYDELDDRFRLCSVVEPRTANVPQGAAVCCVRFYMKRYTRESSGLYRLMARNEHGFAEARFNFDYADSQLEIEMPVRRPVE